MPGHEMRTKAGDKEELTVLPHTKTFCRSQLPYKSVNLSVTIIDTQNNLTDLCGNLLMQNDFKNTLCEMKSAPLATSHTVD